MSKGLEALERLNSIVAYDENEELIPIDEDLSIIEKELKALEIIKNKKVDVKYLYYRAEFNVEKYNDNYLETLTKEECALLKEALL